MARTPAHGETRGPGPLVLVFASGLLLAALCACGSAVSGALDVVQRDLESLRAPTAEEAASYLSPETLAELEAAGIAPEAFLGALFQKAEFADLAVEEGASDASAVVSFTATAVDLGWVRSQIASRILAMGSDGGSRTSGAALVMEVLDADDAPTVAKDVSVAMGRSGDTWVPQLPGEFLTAALAGQDLPDLAGAS